MKRGPGKPFKVDRKLAISAIKKRKSNIFLANNKIISKTDAVWSSISKDLNNQLSSRTLYSMVCNPNIRRQILCSTPDCNISSVEDPSNDDSAEPPVLMSDENDSSLDPHINKFTIWSEKSEFEKLLQEAVYKRRDGTKHRERHCMILKPGLWQEWITRQIWNATRSRCAYNFKNSKITQEGTSGSMQGTCDCGGTITCQIDNCVETPTNSTRIDCMVTKGEGQCGKRYLRAPIRQAIGRELCTKSATIYRSEKAEQMMLPGDPEPPHLYNTTALINAKHEYLASQHIHRDPIIALQIMKRQSFKNAIHGIGLDPFYVHYWTNHQIHVYRAYAKKEPACIAIDATGSIIKPLDRCDQTKTSNIFLYHAVVHNENGQFSVAQMISERHTTVAISFWLAEWVSQAATYPKEVVCDSSKALLGAAIKIFTSHPTIEDYASACSNPVLPKCFVRIDVAHFLKMYADFLKTSSQRVKLLYMAAIGQLIQVRDVHSAGELLRSILLIARSETDGNLPSGRRTQCDIHKTLLKDQINPCLEVPDVDCDTSPVVRPDEDSVFDDNTFSNYWSTWAKEIDLEVKTITEIEEGDHDNAHYLPRLADRLLSDIRWFPLWSSVCRDRFNYGRVPASSASVESEFNIIKTHLLRNEAKPMRADVFVDKHISYLSGRIKIIDAKSVQCSADRDTGHIATDQISFDHEVDATFGENLPDHRSQLVRDYSRSSSVVGLTIPVNNNPETQNEDDIAFELSATAKIRTNEKTCMLCFAPFRVTTNSVEIGTPTVSTLCLDCAEHNNKSEVLASRETEDWRGLTTKAAKKENRYLKKNHGTYNAITLTKNSKIPIMKNGNNLKMQASKIGKEEYSFTKTCAFDSVLHAILVAACDRPSVREAVGNLMHANPLLNLVEDIIRNGLRAHSYRLRAKILIDIYPPQKSIGDSHLIDCGCNVCYLVSKIFIDTPSIEEVSICMGGCEPRRKNLRSIFVPRELLLDACKFENFLTEHVAIRGKRICPTTDCGGTVNTQFSSTGPFIMIEIDDSVSIPLSSLPMSFCDPMSNGEDRFTLIGIVDFKPPPTRTRLSGDELTAVGHYTAIVLRPPQTWMEFDDLKDKPSRVSVKYNAKPHLLIYFKLSG